jgi:CheY-like chemotaxis protein/HPt (histidine-containing phosphotransfer) domain-containing protein
MKTTPMPRILLVEDDAVSRAFLAAAVEALPAMVDAAADCAQARQLASQHPGHDLWLVDANLPDGSGTDLLTTLRAASPHTPALAHTASQRRTDLDPLLAAGFLEVLVKPITARALQAAIRRTLDGGIAMTATTTDSAAGACVKLPNWDDTAALAALKGEQAHVDALRRLFLDELPAQRQAVLAALAAGDIERAGRDLHRLRASCGFVGAARLAEAVRGLESEPRSDGALQRFDDAAGDLLAPA